MKYETHFQAREKRIHPFVSGDSSKPAAKADATNDHLGMAVSKTSTMATSSSIGRNEQEISTLIANEKRRLEKIAILQQKELMRMLAFEAKSKEIMVCKSLRW